MANTDQFGDSVKKILLAGIGAAAITAEKSKELLDQLAEKGALTVEQGKALNEELKHNRKLKDLDDFLDNMTPEQMEELKGKILQRESSEEECEEPGDIRQNDQPETESHTETV
ncbi:MAG: hypothetical protein LUD12_00775 [Lachnospiraceae bacterium]|nr:hypothetical protein [Lachnospiraceae bacterium]